MALRSATAKSSKNPYLRHLRQLLVVSVATAGLFVACSSDQSSRFRGGDTASTSSGAGGSNTTTGLLTGSTGVAGTLNPTTGSGGGGGSGPPPLTPCDPPGMPCPKDAMGKDQICVKAPMGMSGGVCSPNGGPCDPMHDT